MYTFNLYTHVDYTIICCTCWTVDVFKNVSNRNRSAFGSSVCLSGRKRLGLRRLQIVEQVIRHLLYYKRRMYVWGFVSHFASVLIWRLFVSNSNDSVLLTSTIQQYCWFCHNFNHFSKERLLSFNKCLVRWEFAVVWWSTMT